MNDTMANWEAKIENDGFELRIKCINNDLSSELLIEGEKAYNSNNNETSNYIREKMQSLTPDGMFKYAKNFLDKIQKYQQYITDNFDKIGSQTQGNANNIFLLAVKIFTILYTQIQQYIQTSPLNKIQNQCILEQENIEKEIKSLERETVEDVQKKIRHTFAKLFEKGLGNEEKDENGQYVFSIEASLYKVIDQLKYLKEKRIIEVPDDDDENIELFIRKYFKDDNVKSLEANLRTWKSNQRRKNRNSNS